MKGVTPVIAEMFLVGITISLISAAFYFYQTTLESSKEIVEKEGERIYCDISSNFIIKEVSGKNITIWNNGGSKLNLEYFRVYVNEKPVNFNSTVSILEQNNLTIFVLDNNISLDSIIRVFGNCNTGDSFIVK